MSEKAKNNIGTPKKTERISIRVTELHKKNLQTAAKMCNTTLSDFLLMGGAKLMEMITMDLIEQEKEKEHA